MVVPPDKEKSGVNQVMEDRLDTDWQTSTVKKGFLERGSGLCKDKKDWKIQGKINLLLVQTIPAVICCF